MSIDEMVDREIDSGVGDVLKKIKCVSCGEEFLVPDIYNMFICQPCRDKVTEWKQSHSL